MSWDFETDADFQRQLDWVTEFVRNDVEPLDLIVQDPYDLGDPVRQALIPPLQDRVRERGLWACHLGPELGGPGYGQVKLALLNEILGRSFAAPVVFGCQAPDSGNSEILAHFGTAEQKRQWLEPLLAGQLMSAFAMTEPQGGADPQVIATTAVQDGGEWVLNGEKWYVTSAHCAAITIVMALTDPDAEPHRRHSMFLVPTGTTGAEIVRSVRSGTETRAGHGYLRYTDARIPADHLLGPRGEAFHVAQTRLGGGRIHHAMRTVGQVGAVLDMMCERAVSRYTQGEQLSRKQLVQQAVAESWLQLETFRLLVLRTAWRIDKFQDYERVRADISAVKALMPRVLHDVTARALQLHGSLGISQEMPFLTYLADSFHMGLADGPTEVHLIALARRVLAGRTPSPDAFPTTHLPRLQEQALRKYGALESFTRR